MKQINVMGHDLLVAARKNRLDEVQRLLSQQGLVVVCDEKGNSALHWAVHNNNLAMVKLLRMHGFPRGQRNHGMFTPLVLAAELKHWSCVEEIAQTKAANGEGFDAALICAVKEEQYVTAKKLLKCGAGSNARWYPTQYTALHWAVQNNSPEMVALLLRHGAKPTLMDDLGLTPLSLAVSRGFWPCVVALCKNTALQEKEYSEALLAAARANQYQAVKALLAVGAKPNLLTSQENGYSALHWTVVKDNFEMAALLMRFGADITTKDDNGYTPMHLAISGQRNTLIAWFKALGVRNDITDVSGESAAMMASRLGSPDCIDALYKKDREPHPAALAVAQGEAEKIEAMLSRNDLSLATKINKEGDTALEYAVRLKQIPLISLLTRQIAQEGKVKEVAFKLAVSLGYWECARVIDKERAMTEQLDRRYSKQLSMFSFTNSTVKQAFINEARLVGDEDVDKARFYKLMAATKTASYRQFKFWSREPTNTTCFFQQKEHAPESPTQQVIVS